MWGGLGRTEVDWGVFWRTGRLGAEQMTSNDVTFYFKRLFALHLNSPLAQMTSDDVSPLMLCHK